MKIKSILLGLLLTLTVLVQAQTSVVSPMYNPGTTFTLANLGTTTVVRDTVTNTGTGYLNSRRLGGPGTVTIVVTATKVSGTQAGTITLQGSLDGTTYVALTTSETQTALATITAADATTNYTWRLASSPYLYYRVSWAGASTMVSYLNAYIMKH